MTALTSSRVVVAACVFLGVASAAVNRGKPVKELMPWYHSTDEIHQEITDLASACQGASLELSTRSQLNSADAAGQEVVLDVVHVRSSSSGIDPVSPSGPRKKAMFVFGEHARELISPESGLAFLRALCGQGQNGRQAAAVLDKVDFTIIPNANPLGRKQVEDGYYCKRTNEDGVDLNRNWGDKHREGAESKMGDEMDPGPRGFSEPETVILKALVDEERPDLYLSVHSGAYLLGTPFGFGAEGQPKNENAMMDVLKPISERHCGGQCPYGGLAELIHYKSMGCDLDYVSEELGTPFAFTWEIYVGPKFRDGYVAEAQERSGSGSEDSLNLIQRNSRGSRQRLRGGRGTTSTSIMSEKLAQQLEELELAEASTPESQQDAEGCIEQFLPRGEGETTEVSENWAGAFLELSAAVAAKLASGNSTSP